jgi:ADP-ribose pyrophosphatase YjhB (NUDIX family)
MAKSSKLVAAKRGQVLLVRRKRDGLWMFPGGRKLARESDKDCLRREIKEELPKLKLGRLRVCPGTSNGITEFSEHEAD